MSPDGRVASTMNVENVLNQRRLEFDQCHFASGSVFAAVCLCVFDYMIRKRRLIRYFGSGCQRQPELEPVDGVRDDDCVEPSKCYLTSVKGINGNEISDGGTNAEASGSFTKIFILIEVEIGGATSVLWWSFAGSG